ncbi:unnamed protein product, partial [Ilex paraguariensis]
GLLDVELGTFRRMLKGKKKECDPDSNDGDGLDVMQPKHGGAREDGETNDTTIGGVLS